MRCIATKAHNSFIPRLLEQQSFEEVLLLNKTTYTASARRLAALLRSARTGANARSIRWVRGYERLLLVLFALSPVPLIIYVQLFQAPDHVFHSHGFHEIAIGIAILTSAAVTIVAGVCYRDSGEPMLRWLTLALLGFTLVYAPHGILTRLAADNPPLFLLYGPASRLVMAGFLFVGLLHQRAPTDSQAKRHHARLWLPWIGALLLLDVLIAVIAVNPDMPHAYVRFVMEGGAVLFCGAAVLVLLLQPRVSPLLLFFGLGICFFAQSSLGFFLAKPWNHQWWLAHAVFAAGFTLMSFGVVRAFLTTRTLVAVFGADEWMQQVLAANTRAAEAIDQLNESNQQLAVLANTDGLTGLWNRRHFMARASEEISDRIAMQEPFSVMIIDLDHFKQINDTHGHDLGDQVLCAFAQALTRSLRQSVDTDRQRRLDIVGRIGGEEFAVLVPQSASSGARFAAERIRNACQGIRILDANSEVIPISASIGVAHWPADGANLATLLAVADKRLYVAKNGGRNRVQAA